MKKKYILGGLMAFCLSQCSGCNKDSKPERKNDGREEDCLTMLKSTFANFSQQGREVTVNLNKISTSFENLRKILPESWIKPFNEAITTTTTFLKSIAKKPGENLKDKIAVLQQIVSLYTDKIEKNHKKTGQVSEVELFILGEGFNKCLEQLLDATDNFDFAFSLFQDCSLTFGALEKLFKTPKEQAAEYSKIDALFQQNYPINEMAKSILKGLMYWIPENLKGYYDSLVSLFSDNKDKNPSKAEMETIVKKTNEKIFDLYKKLVELTVEKKSGDFIGSLNLDKGKSKFTYFPSQELKGDGQTIEQQTTDLTHSVFLSKYINIFQLYFSASYHLDIHESYDDTGKPKWVIKFSLDNFDPDNKNKFFTDFKGECILKIEKTTDGNNLHYVSFQNKEDGSKFFSDKNNPELLTLDDKLYDGIQRLHLMLSAGFDIAKNDATKKLEKTIDPVAEHLLQTPEFSSFKEDGSVKKFKDICSTPLGSVASLWMIFKDAYDDFKIAKAANNDNKRIFHDLWTLRNTAHYIQTSCNKYHDILGGDDNEFVETILMSIRDGQEVDDEDSTQIPGIDNFWTTFLGKTDVKFKHTAVQLALAEYFVMRCGLFNKDVQFKKNGELEELINDENKSMSYDNMHTFGLYKWINNDVLEVTPENIITLDNFLNTFFGIDQTITENAQTLGEEVFDKHINKGKNWLVNFLKVRNKFYSTYPDGIYNLKDKEAIKNFLIDVARVAQAADNVKNVDDGQHVLFNWVVDNILNKVYGSETILKHVETCFATNEEECKKYIAAYWMKFVSKLLDGNVVMDFKVAPICQSLGIINNVDDAKNINLEGIIKNNRKKRILKRETNNYNNSELIQPSPFNKNELYKGYVSEKGVGIDAIIADICAIVKKNWTDLNPKFGDGNKADNILKNHSIEKWFKDFKIYIYILGSRQKRFLYVGEPVRNSDTFFKDNNKKYFKLQRDLHDEIFADSSSDTNEKQSELQSGKNKDGEHVARSTTYTFPEGSDEKTFKMEYKDKAPLTQMFYNITAKYSKSMEDMPDPWDVDNIKFLGPLFGMDDIIKRNIKISVEEYVPGFIFKFDYYGYSDLYGQYDTGEKDSSNSSISKNDWIRVQNCQM